MSKESKKLMKYNLFMFVKKFSQKIKYTCVYDTVKQTTKYDNHTFILNNRKVKPIIYSGIWIDPDSAWDHCIRGDDYDFWYTYDGKVFIIAEVNNKFYIPKINFSSECWQDSNHELEDESIDIANERHLVFDHFSSYDKFTEQKFEDVIQLIDINDKSHDKKFTFEDLVKCCNELPYDESDNTFNKMNDILDKI